MLGFYSCELLGSMLNFLCSCFGYYPSLDLGVRFLILLESKRVVSETLDRQEDRDKKEAEAKKLELEARNGFGEDV